MKPAIILVLLFAAALAGCAESKETQTDPEPINQATGKLAKDVNATVQDGSFVNANEADSFILPATTGPDTPLTSFHWRIPEGSFVRHEFIDSWEVLPLEMLPVTDAEMSDWGITVFQTDGAEAQLVGSYTAVTSHQVSKLAVLPTESTFTPTLSGFFLTLYDFEIEEGDRLTFIVHGTSAETAPLDFVFRIMDHDPSWQEDPAEKASEVLVGKVAELLPYATGSGYQVAMYLDINFLVAFGAEAWTDAVTVTDRIPVDARPMAAVRDVSISASMDSDGYSQGIGIYFAGDAAGLWSVDVDSHGTQMEAGSIILDSSVPFIGIVPSLVIGSPIYIFQADGAGSSEATFNLQYVRGSTSTFSDVLIFAQVDMGATLEQMTGVPASDYAFAFTGLAGDIPPSHVELRGDDLVIEGAVTQVFKGVLSSGHTN